MLTLHPTATHFLVRRESPQPTDAGFSFSFAPHKFVKGKKKKSIFAETVHKPIVSFISNHITIHYKDNKCTNNTSFAI